MFFVKNKRNKLIGCFVGALFSLFLFGFSAQADVVNVENIECKNGYGMDTKNLNNGKCRVRWDIIQVNVTNQVISSLVSGFGRMEH